jgi:hypothetical protein
MRSRTWPSPPRVSALRVGSREKNRAKHPRRGSRGEQASTSRSMISFIPFGNQSLPTPSLTYPLLPPSLRQVLSVMRVSARPTIASFRQIISRRFASTEAQNPQVKAAVESATKAYDNALGSAKRVAGPIGERVGSMMGGECVRCIGWKGDRCVAASRSCLSEPHIPYNPLTTYHLFRLDLRRLQRPHRLQLQGPRLARPSSLHCREDGTPDEPLGVRQLVRQHLVQRRLAQLLEGARSERTVG